MLIICFFLLLIAEMYSLFYCCDVFNGTTECCDMLSCYEAQCLFTIITKNEIAVMSSKKDAADVCAEEGVSLIITITHSSLFIYL